MTNNDTNMQPPPRWPPQPPWMRPGARPVGFIPPLPPPYGCRASVFPPRGYFPRFVPPPCPPPLNRRPVVDTEQLWLDTFKRTQCYSINDYKEPPLRLFRRRIAQTQKLVEQLKAAAMELAVIEKKMEMLHTVSSEEGVHSMEDLRLKVQYEHQLEVCETLKKQLEAMNTTSGLFPKEQVTEIRNFARRVKKKKAYRKRAKVRRRADASIRRAIDLKIRDVESTGKDVVELKIIEDDLQPIEETTVSSPSRRVVHTQQTATCLATNERNLSKQSLDPEILKIDALIAVRRAWDSFIAFPQTVGASTIPPHYVPPSPASSVQWAEYVASSARVGIGG